MNPQQAFTLKMSGRYWKFLMKWFNNGTPLSSLNITLMLLKQRIGSLIWALRAVMAEGS